MKLPANHTNCQIFRKSIQKNIMQNELNFLLLLLVVPLLGSPLKILSDFSALAVRPFDANHVGVSGIGIKRINEATEIPQLIPLTIRQFVCRNETFKLTNYESTAKRTRSYRYKITKNVNN